MASKQTRGRFVTYWLPVLAWMAVIEVGTSIPHPPGLPVEGGDKIAHFVVYAVLGALLVRAFRGAVGLATWQAALASILSGSVYGALDEIHQAFLPTRSCSAGDLLADAIGVVGAVAIASVIGHATRQTHMDTQPNTEPHHKEEMEVMSELTLSKDNFESEIIESDQPCLVDFWAPWCGPCLMMGPTLEKVAEKYAGKAKVGKVNVDENGALATKYGIRSIPALLFFKGGEVVAQAVGVQTEDALTNQLDDMME